MHDLPDAKTAPRAAARRAARTAAAHAARRPARNIAGGLACCTGLLLTGTALVSLGGCASSAGIAPVVQALTSEALGLDAASSTAAGQAIEADRWRRFGDSRLDALVERALAGQPDLQAVQARLARAQATVSGLSSAGGRGGAVAAAGQRAGRPAGAPARRAGGALAGGGRRP